MAKDKDRSANPAQAQRRLDKQKAVKKGKADAQTRRNEKLARRNPDRLQRQINDIQAAEQAGQPLKPRERQHLEELQRDLRAVCKARDALGDQAPRFRSDAVETEGGAGPKGPGHHAQVLGKRRRPGASGFDPYASSSGSDTDESVRAIPMPRDTPPPVPRPHQWRAHRRSGQAGHQADGGDGVGGPSRGSSAAPPPKTVYEAAPEIRDLRQEAVARFVPAAVRRKQESASGTGGRLVEPEEMDQLERQGYGPPGGGEGRMGDTNDSGVTTAGSAGAPDDSKAARVEDAEDEEG